MCSYVQYALAWIIFCSCGFVYCTDRVLWHLPKPYPKYFVDDVVTASCGGNVNSSSGMLLKENVTLGNFKESGLTVIAGNIEVNSSISNTYSHLVVTWRNLTKENSGNYTCQFNQQRSADFSLQVAERPKNVLCEFQDDDRLGFLVGEELQLSCYNPFNKGGRGLMRTWYVNNGANLQGVHTHPESTSNYTTANTPLAVEENSTTFNCLLTKNDSILQNQSYSCSVGPILEYNSSFNQLGSFEGSSTLTTESVTINCRIVPRDKDASYHWTVEPLRANSTESISDTDSNLTLSDFQLETNINLETRITCVGQLGEQNYTAEYILVVFNVNTTVADLGQLPLRHIVIATSAVFAVLAIVVTVCGCRYSFCKRPVRKKDRAESSMTGNEDVITKPNFGASGFAENSNDYLVPGPSRDVKITHPGPPAYQSSTNERNQGFFKKESYKDPMDKFSGYPTAPHGDSATSFDAYGRPVFAPPYHSLPSMNEHQMQLGTSIEMIPTWDDELSYEEPFDEQSSHHSEVYPLEYESPMEEGVSMNAVVNDDLWDYENAGIRR